MRGRIVQDIACMIDGMSSSTLAMSNNILSGYVAGNDDLMIDFNAANVLIIIICKRHTEKDMNTRINVYEI